MTDAIVIRVPARGRSRDCSHSSEELFDVTDGQTDDTRIGISGHITRRPLIFVLEILFSLNIIRSYERRRRNLSNDK